MIARPDSLSLKQGAQTLSNRGRAANEGCYERELERVVPWVKWKDEV